MFKEDQAKLLEMFNEMLNPAETNALLKSTKKSEKGDDVDLITQNQAKSLKQRLDSRNVLFLKKVESAKQKILDGTFGECEECGSDISQKRLAARPTANCCIECQEEKEKGEFGKISKRRDLTANKFDEENPDSHIQELKTYGNIKDISFESVVDL